MRAVKWIVRRLLELPFWIMSPVLLGAWLLSKLGEWANDGKLK